MDFNKGLKDGIPVALGYFSVSIAFGLMAIENECSALEAVLITVTNLTSAGQFAGVTVLAAMGTYVDTAGHQFPLFPDGDFPFPESGREIPRRLEVAAGIRYHR